MSESLIFVLLIIFSLLLYGLYMAFAIFDFKWVCVGIITLVLILAIIAFFGLTIGFGHAAK